MDSGKRFVFIGCGNVAYYHADVILAQGHQIVGVAARHQSQNIAPFSQKYKIESCYKDYGKMFDELQPDAAILCTSWDQTEKILTEVVREGIPVLVEKPVALSLQKLKNILEEVNSFSHNVLVGYNRRFYDFIPILKETIFEQELLSVQLNFPEAVTVLEQLVSASIKDHILIYQSSHWIDLVLYLLGELELIVMQKKTEAGGYVFSYSGMLRTVNGGVPVHYSSHFDTPQRISIRFVFKNSVWELCPIEKLSVYGGLERIEPSTEYPVRQYIPKVVNEFQTDFTYKPGFFKQMEYFVDAYLLRKSQNKLGCTLEDTLMLTRLCDQIQNGKESATI